MGTMEKAGIAVVGVLILIIIGVGLVNKNTESDDTTKNKTTVANHESNSKSKSDDKNSDGRNRLNRNIKVDLGGTGKKSNNKKPKAGGAAAVKKKKTPGVKKGESGGGREVDLKNPTVKPKPLKGGRTPAKALVSSHTIKNGENMTRLAQKYYGNANLYWVIKRANPKVNPRTLKAGDKLLIPNRDLVLAKMAEAKKDKAARAKSGDVRLVSVSTERPSFIPDSYIKDYSSKSPARKNSKPKSKTNAPLQPYKKGDKTYTVRSNDNLGVIAQKTLGSSRHAGKIFAANKSLMKSPDRLQIGWVLTIPAIN